VYRLPVRVSEEFFLPRDVYVAMPRDETVAHIPLVFATCVICRLSSDDILIVDWLEVASISRRRGIATEFLTALERHLGPLSYAPATPDGEAFCASLGDPAPA
jgi:hypothetical protein